MVNTRAIRSPRQAATLLAHPVRNQILARARTPISAADLARHLDLPRQRVNYHVRQLAAAGFLTTVAQQKKRNMLEQQYVASARYYVFDPALLGDVAPAHAAVSDMASASDLVALCAAAQADVTSVMESADEAGLRVRTLSIAADLRFETAGARAAFTRALQDAVNDVIALYASPTGREFRVIVGGYPVTGGTRGAGSL